MNNRLFFFILGIMVWPQCLFGADQADRIRRLDLQGSTYTPGGEPAPLMVLVPREEFKEEKPVSNYVRFVLKAFFEVPPKGVIKSLNASNEITQECYPAEEIVRVSLCSKDFKKILNDFHKK